MFYVYVLKSKLNDEIYIGSTTVLKRRLQEHNDGKHISTKRYVPWRLVYYEAYETEELARVREKRLKQHGNAKHELKKRIGMLSQKGPKAGAGFTLIEILVAIVVASIIGAGILGLQYILGQNQLVVWRNYLSVDEANTSVTTLVREIRTARVSENGAYLLERAEDQQIIFYSDIDFDGETEKVRYFLNGTQFIKEVIEPTGEPSTYPEANKKVKVLTDNVRNGETPIFYYYNGDWPEDSANNPLTTPANTSDTKLIRVFLRLNTKDAEPEKDYVLESYTQIRMSKENL
jgi:putative endonuclease